MNKQEFDVNNFKYPFEALWWEMPPPHVPPTPNSVEGDTWDEKVSEWNSNPEKVEKVATEYKRC